MSWNECLYRYHKQYGGVYVGGRDDDGLLVLTWKDRPLAVDIRTASAGRSGTFSCVQARISVALGRPYKLTIGAENKLSGGVNAVLKAAPGLSGFSALPADFGFPEFTKKRLIRSDNHPFTKLVLGSLDFRNALLACPKEKLEVCPSFDNGPHTILITSTISLTASQGSSENGWYLGTSGDYTELYGTEEEKRRLAQRVETEFFPRLDRFLELARAAYNAVVQWPIS